MVRCFRGRMLTEHVIVRWHGNGVTVRSMLDGTEETIPASALVMATTNLAFDPFLERIPGKEVHRIGDCATPQQAPPSLDRDHRRCLWYARRWRRPLTPRSLGLRPPRTPSMSGAMRTIDPQQSSLLLIDLQARLMPAIQDGAAVVAQARRLLEAAALFGVPVVATEQNPRALGPTVPDLAIEPGAVLAKMTFDALREPEGVDRLPPGRAYVVAGCEAHVCVLQTVLGLLDLGRPVFVVADAVGSRRAENREAALRRMERHGAEIVTAEMVIFEWLGSCEHPRFREALALVR